MKVQVIKNCLSGRCITLYRIPSDPPKISMTQRASSPRAARGPQL